MAITRILFILLALLGIACCPAAETPPAPAPEAVVPELLVQEARYGEAAAAFIARSEGFAKEGDRVRAAGDLLNAASCLRASGDVSVAGVMIGRAEDLLGDKGPPALVTELLAQKGSIRAMGRDPESALKVLHEAARRAAAEGKQGLLTDIWNDLGIAYSAMDDPAAAMEQFAAAEESAREMGDAGLVMRCRQNQVVAAFTRWDQLRQKLEWQEETGDWAGPTRAALAQAMKGFEANFAASRRLAEGAGDSEAAVFHSLTAGMAGARYGRMGEAFPLLRAGLEMARRTGNLMLERAALLALAEVYLDAAQPAQALELLDHARTIQGEPEATQSAQLELLTAMCHQKIHPGSAKIPEALKRSIRHLDEIRSDITRTQAISDLGRSFRERAGRAYLMLADYHLQAQPGSAEAGKTAQREAREEVENFKAWELQDFFRDDCVNVSLIEKIQLDDIPDGEVGILYVIPFESRTEILLGHRGNSHRWTVAVGAGRISALARKLRYSLESDYGTYSYKAPAEELYEVLIRPLQAFLQAQGIKHLVFIPDGPLGNIPLAVLRDRQRKCFLLEDYSVSVSPSLSLIPFERLEPEHAAALIFGTDQGFMGAPPLPAIAGETAALAKFYPAYPPLMNREFTADSFATRITDTPANIVHIACHGEFKGKPGETYLLASDRKIDMDDVEKAIRPKKHLGKPVELLCLSACRTAAGDDRAALGLAGAAVKSGSRSVVATLWYVDDTATSEIMVDFHRRLLEGKGRYKCAALREAQLAFLQRDRLAHPRQWAPFVLIGNWK